jgi:hypothetical protein
LLQIKKAVGMFQGLPLWLVVQPVLTEKATVYCAHIELRAADVVEAQRNALEAAKMRTSLIGEVADLNRSYRAMLQAPASTDEPEEEQAAVAAEFEHENEGNAADGPARPPEGRSSFANRPASSAAPLADPEVIDHDPTTGEVIEQKPAITPAVASTTTATEAGF